MSLNGFVNGLMQPSRDMIVRAVTPEGQFGKVFGFVTTGFNIGGIIAPLMFGYVMDAGHPRAVFFLVCGLSLLAILIADSELPAPPAPRLSRSLARRASFE